MRVDLNRLLFEQNIPTDYIERNGKRIRRMHVAIHDDSRYKDSQTVALTNNLEHGIKQSPKKRQMHIITDDCYEEYMDMLDGEEVLVCLYYIPSGAYLDEGFFTYHFPSDKIDVSTDAIPDSYLTADKVKAMLDRKQERIDTLANNPVIIEKTIIKDKRDIAYERLEAGDYNDYVRKPLNPSSKEYKEGKRAIPKLFRFYLKSLLEAGLNDVTTEIRNNIPNGNPHKGRSGIPPYDYLFYLIDQVHEDKPDFEYEGMMPSIVKDGYVSKEWRANAFGGYGGREGIIPLLEYLVSYSAQPMQKHENLFAVDGTGLTCTLKGEYNHAKHGKDKHTIWMDAHTLIGVNSNIVCAVKASVHRKLDELEALESLINNMNRYFSIRYLLADAGYMSEDKLNYLYDKYGIRLVFPIKHNTVITSPKSSDLWNDNNRLNLSTIWGDIYHPRSNVEATFSALKRTIGEEISSKNQTARLSEVYCKFIVYNIRALIMYYFVAGILPHWVDYKGLKAHLGNNEQD